jgi:hypothetical protein
LRAACRLHGCTAQGQPSHRYRVRGNYKYSGVLKSGYCRYSGVRRVPPTPRSARAPSHSTRRRRR